jgi:hypothetical protein
LKSRKPKSGPVGKWFGMEKRGKWGKLQSGEKAEEGVRMLPCEMTDASMRCPMVGLKERAAKESSITGIEH